ncbi:hypothetical protein CDAR_12071 [Caerostris darwini]|uniref:Uncharacterized protein n=1 Tax=Caerostris darwini TaxID=1538125 RepID=A0AAV4M3H6_9ARAC|nr:hypothetical protein CDAR_12071 [Caerostris darwini]
MPNITYRNSPMDLLHGMTRVRNGTGGVVGRVGVPPLPPGEIIFEKILMSKLHIYDEPFSNSYYMVVKRTIELNDGLQMNHFHGGPCVYVQYLRTSTHALKFMRCLGTAFAAVIYLGCYAHDCKVWIGG